ncbi:MAG: tetratricopeptide repeat protein [Candidatus Limnocylindria bacterium]
MRRAILILPLLLALGPGGCASFEAARLYRSGTAALEAGAPERAVADLERAAALAPEASDVQNHLGLAYAAAGRPGDAERAFRRALELDCDNAAARENLHAAELRSAGNPP